MAAPPPGTETVPACSRCNQNPGTITDDPERPMCRTCFVQSGGHLPGVFGPLREREPMPIERDCSFCNAKAGDKCHGAMPNPDGTFNVLPYFHAARRHVRKGAFF